MAFPVSPVNGQTATINGISHVYNSTSGTWTRVVVVNSTTSATAPANPKVGDIWYDTATDDVYRYTTDGVGFYWLDITGPTVASAVTYLNTNVYANSFNGSSQYLSVANNTPLNLDAAFTFEGWFNFTLLSGSADNIFYSKLIVTPSLTGVELGVTASGSKLYAWVNGSVSTGGTTIVVNRWYHFAITRDSSNNLRLFVNGVSDATAVTYAGDTTTTSPAYIAAAYTPAGRITGSISNFRIVKGTALYTAAFTVPTAPLTATTNTSLLTCQTIPAVDASSNAFAITNTGGVGLSLYSAQQSPSLTFPINPTQTIFTATSTGTYIVPANVKWLRVRMIGGGGGGGGGGTNGFSGGNAGTGGVSTFGTSLLTAYGGLGGQNYADTGAVGGTATITISAGVSGIALQGASGSGGATPSGNYPPGGTGGVSPFGGGGAGGVVDSPTGLENAIPNTGSGGGGGGGLITSTSRGGGGGGAGGYIEVIISSVTSSYSYGVGAGGTAGPAGTSGQVGGSGASGIIIIEEHYNY
jgi:hypothetical protein